MTLRELLHRLARPIPVVYAALCSAYANAPQSRYPIGERHTILGMIRCDACDLEQAMTTLLESHGWNNVVIEEWERLEVPFLTADHEVRACYVSAMTSDGGLLVYADPLQDR